MYCAPVAALSYRRAYEENERIVPATTIIAQMDSGIAITVMVYPVALLKEQAHRVVINYKTEDVISARRAAGLAINLTAPEPSSEGMPVKAVSVTEPAAELAIPTKPVEPINLSAPNPDYSEPAEAAISDAIKNPKWFRNWTSPRHGLRISALPSRDLTEAARLVLFAVRNTGTDTLRLISGYPDLYVETVNEKRRPVETGTRVPQLYLASSTSDARIQPGATRYFALVYEVPILGTQQHLKVVVAHMSAADEPATADLTKPASEGGKR